MRKSIIKKFQEFYNGNKDVVFYEQELRHRDRLLLILETKIDDLCITDQEMYNQVKLKYPEMDYPTVLRDINIIERMIANDLNPSGNPMKTFMRYFIVENAKKAIKMAERNEDPKAIALLLNTMGKHMLTDKEDIVKPDYEKIIPFEPELTDDPSVLGISLPENFEEIREKYKRKFESDYQNFVRKMAVTEAEIVKDEEDGD
jgi:hypothetical protein